MTEFYSSDPVTLIKTAYFSDFPQEFFLLPNIALHWYNVSRGYLHPPRGNENRGRQIQIERSLSAKLFTA